MASVPLIPIMNIPSIKTAEKEDENLSAVILCKEKKIKSQNDRKALDEAKDICYKKGFHEGVMIIGDYKGSKVLEAKNLVKKELIDKKFALTYYEPNGNVVSRSGDTCVVKYCEQWFINYANEKWKSKVIAHV